MTERLTVEMVDELAAREDHEDGSDRYYHLLGTVTSPVLIRAALVERDDVLQRLAEVERLRRQAVSETELWRGSHRAWEAKAEKLRADVAALTQALETAQARIDELVSERERDAAPAEPSTAEQYETLTEAPSTYEALLNGADAIDARRKGDA